MKKIRYLKNKLATTVLSGMVATLVSPIGSQAADLNISIGSCPVGCTAYTWSAGIADVVNRNVDGVRMTAEETKRLCCEHQVTTKR